MRERRNSGATHSFRLSREASELVDAIQHPRRHGGKSRKVSLALEWYFAQRGEMPSYHDLLDSIDKLQAIITEMGEVQANNDESDPQVPAWWRRFLPKRCQK
jgi:hypothetical protein